MNLHSLLKGKIMKTDQIKEMERNRTLAVVKELMKGKTITLDDFTIGMGDDMRIGVIAENQETKEKWILGLSTMDLCELNNLLTKHHFWPVPN